MRTILIKHPAKGYYAGVDNGLKPMYDKRKVFAKHFTKIGDAMNERTYWKLRGTMLAVA